MTKGPVALITGASGGLGLEFSKLCAADGYDLVLVARNEGKLYAIKNDLERRYGIAAFVCPQDLSSKDAALNVFDYTIEHGLDVDVLINNAGFGDSGAFWKRDWERQQDMVQVDIVALMQLTHCFLPQMLTRGSGKILNLSSVAAFCAGPYMSVYYASKEFVRSFSEALFEETRGTGVTVTALCPPPTATGFESAADMGSESKMFRKAARAEDVARIGYKAMQKGKALCYCGAFTKLMGFGSRLVSRKVARRFATKMDR
ncbi:MAG: SDR family NAD(P)-dependent oxidoreductase [Coriobacteriales bacterium]|jgi:short-subunit dehydrogenase